MLHDQSLALLLTAATLLGATREGSPHGGCTNPTLPRIPPPPGFAPGDAASTARPRTGPAVRPSNGPAVPATPSSARAPGPSGPRTPGGIELAPDFTEWRYWWEFHQAPFLLLKDAVHATGAATWSDTFFMGPGGSRGDVSLAPTEADIRDSVVPALLEAWRQNDGDRDIESACMLSLARLAGSVPSLDLVGRIRSRLSSADQEIREIAALSLGLTRRPGAATELAALVADDAAGRRLCQRVDVDHRTRAFAAYGLGLIAEASVDLGVQRRVFTVLDAALHGPERNRDVRVAVIQALGLLDPEPGSAKGRLLLAHALASLERFLRRELGAGDQVVRAHVPTAIARLLRGRDAPVERGYYAGVCARIVEDFERESELVVQSAVVALGDLADPWQDETSPDRALSERLVHHYEGARDQQGAYFALMSLARIGGARNREALLRAFRDGQTALQKPWAALALGVLARRELERSGGEPDAMIGHALLDQLRRTRTPGTLGAIAVALGLGEHRDAADELRALLEQNTHRDEFAGYLCIALALLDDQRSLPVIQRIVRGAAQRPGLLQQATIALGKLGDKSAAPMLLDMLGGEDSNAARRAAVAASLRLIGDRRTVAPLLRLCQEGALPKQSRGYVLLALGGVVDRAALPWNARIAEPINYRAVVDTLTDQRNGILDIL